MEHQAKPFAKAPVETPALSGRQPDSASSPPAPVHPLLRLQRTVGNQAVQRLIQAKRTVNRTGDVCEQEADRIAEQVASPATPMVQRRATTADTLAEAPAVVPTVLSSGSGQPLDAGTRAFMELHFGQDFSGVRVHTNAQAAQSADAINAQAYTSGRDIVFRQGQYAPQTTEGRKLLAHELTHVVQQEGAAPTGRPMQGSRSDVWERQAHAAAAAAVRPRIASAFPTVTRGGAPPVVQHFGSPEHESLGDVTGERNIDLGNGVVLTWGQVIALAGDYYGSADELRNDTLTPDGRVRIRASLEHYNSPDLAAPGAASAALPALDIDPDKKSAQISAAGGRLARLALTNIPHFSGGGTSKETWIGYHEQAISAAVRAGLMRNRNGLNDAYFQEAFGQHFLTDSFSAGHVRTPRKEIDDYYVGTFAPAVVDHLLDYLRERAIDEIYEQIYPQVVGWKGTAVTVAGGAAGYFALRAYVRGKIRDVLEPEIAKLGDRAKLSELIGHAVGGMVSGALHDKDNEEGLLVTSRAHPEVWRAFGDGKLDASQVNRQQAEMAVIAAKEDVDIAYSLAVQESRVRDTAPPPSAIPTAVYFGFNHDDLNPAAVKALNQAALYMTYHPEAYVSLRGHTDPIGTEKYNMGLGERRAQSAASALIFAGIPAARIETSSAGEGELVTTNPARYARDRRVTLVFMTSAIAATQDVALENALDLVRKTIPRPYRAEDYIPTEAAGQNSPIPEWRWGRMDPYLQKDIQEWVVHKLSDYVGQIATADALKDRIVHVNDQDVTISPRPIVQRIANEILADPLGFLTTATGRPAGTSPPAP